MSSFQCGDCKEMFKHGSQGDNEKYCLRCEYVGRKNAEGEQEYYEQLAVSEPVYDWRKDEE